MRYNCYIKKEGFVMYLKIGINYREFLRQVQVCQSEVYYVTVQNDRLNLKSELCKYLFISAAVSSGLLDGGQVECADPGDYELLEDFLQED